jgi:hypothetical protein
MLTSHTHDALLVLHLVAGGAALVVFWLPVAARKGSRLHRSAGRWFAWLMYAVTSSAAVMSLLLLADPLGVRYPDGLPDGGEPGALAVAVRVGALFLLMLALLVGASLRHGVLALAARRDPTVVRRPLHLALLFVLLTVAAFTAWAGIRYESLLLQIFAVLGAVSGGRMLVEALGRPPHGEQDALWMRAHLRGMLVGGIGAYTAFFAFGGSHLFSEWLPGQWQIVPWVLPSVIGGAMIHGWSRRYRQRPAQVAVGGDPAPLTRGPG